MMPPPESNLQLSDYEIALLKRWIEQGAEWKAHWAFIPPEKPAFPKVKKAGWPKNSIDLFTLAKMEAAGLSPNEEAPETKLIRRLSFDLSGLPPTLKEIDEFIADESPNAYEKLVDRLLAKESFGERLAMEWMDLARYADSHGYQDDLERSMWPWRDWIIQAFNQNMPYDQFVSWQLAGDLLPDATYEQKLATGFNRNHKITQEVGVINEEYRVNYVLDRVNTFSTAFLGLTVECAQCHDHKYDPISQKDFYSLFSFFNNVPEKGRVDYGVEVAAPFLPLPKEKVEEISTYIQELFQNEKNRSEDYVARQWEDGFETEEIKSTGNPSSEPIPPGLAAWYPLDHMENQKLEEIVRGKPGEARNELIPIRGKFSGGVEFMGANYARLEPAKALNFNQPFSISFWIKSLDGGIRGTAIAALARARKNEKEKTANLVLHVTNDKTLNVRLHNIGNGSRLQFQTIETLPENKWLHVALTHDGSRKIKGTKVYFNGVQITPPTIQADNLLGVVRPSTIIHLGTQYADFNRKDTTTFFNKSPLGLVSGQLDEIMFFNRQLSEDEIQDLLNYNPMTALLAESTKTESNQKRLFYHQLLHQDPTYEILTNRLRETRIREGRLKDIVLRPTMVMADMDTTRSTYILDRGQYDAPTERVEANTPEVILAFKESYPKNRLGLSQWLFDPENPLTARIAVNRYWQLIFGKGIVETPGDFGSQGSLPSHPELLDWLTVEFIESGWDLKHLIKTMVMSATYRQSVRSNAKLQKLDPDNILLARGPQMRLPAEMIRDHALAISGLLSSNIGGPSVKPYQPEGLWLEVASGNQSLRKYIQDHNQDLYRRSLYTFWKRTIPPPSMTLFDAPSREQCNIKRRATSTPMQALVLLNDPQFTEASRLIAVRMLQEGGNTEEERIQFTFRLATSRLPEAKELKLLHDLLKEEMTNFESSPEAAKKLISVGEYPVLGDFSPHELAAYTVVANAILNLTESIRKG